MLGHVKRKAALVRADVQRLAARMLRSRRVVEPLIEEGACLLPGSRVVGEAESIQEEDSLQLRVRRVLRIQSRKRGRLETFEGGDACISTLDDGLRRDLLDED